MSSEKFAQQISQVHERVDALLRRADQARKQPEKFLPEALAELREAEKALEGAETVLHQQDEQLSATLQALTSERQRYRELFEFTSDGFIRTDPNGTILELNRAATTLLQADEKNALAKPLLNFVALEDRAALGQSLGRAKNGETIKGVEVQLQGQGDSARIVALTIEGISDARGAVSGLRWLLRDITRRKRAEVELARANTVLSSLSHMAARIEATRDPDWVMQTLGGELARLDLSCVVALIDADEENLAIRYFWTDPQVLSQVEELVSDKIVGARIPCDRSNVCGEVVQRGAPIFSADENSVVNLALPQLDDVDAARARDLMGMNEETRVLYLPLRVEEQVIGIMGVWGEELYESDIPTYSIFAGEIAGALEHARLYSELERQRAQLQALSARLVTVLEDERRRIARELHDQAGQLLYGLRLHLDVLARQISPEQSQLQTQVGGLYHLLDEARGKILDLSRELRPAALDELGLEPTLRNLVYEYGRKAGLAVTFESSGTNGHLSSQIETACYRIAQEALTNVAQHAEASQVTVRFGSEEGQIYLEIEDDGRGFETRWARAHGLGLLGIEERAIGLGGSVVIESAPGTGTRMQVILPIAPWEDS